MNRSEKLTIGGLILATLGTATTSLIISVKGNNRSKKVEKEFEEVLPNKLKEENKELVAKAKELNKSTNETLQNLTKTMEVFQKTAEEINSKLKKKPEVTAEEKQ